jgi:streptomycin 6-kinase
MIFEFMNILHHTPSNQPIPTQDQCKANYIDKLLNRFQNADDYPFDNATIYQAECIKRLNKYLECPMKIIPYIHGDLWFSNILLTYQQEVKCIDMKGKVDGLYTVGGDIMYDYGKLYQSILGYDTAIYGTTVSNEYHHRMKEYMKACFIKRGVSIEDVHTVTLSLMMGTFHAISSPVIKERVWNWLITLF